MPLAKRSPLRRAPRNIRAAYLKAVRRRLFAAKAEESAAAKEMFSKGGAPRGEIARWDEAYEDRRDAERLLELAAKKRKK